MTRRRFAFWLSFGLFSLAERLRTSGLDALAAAIMRNAPDASALAKPAMPEHWIATGDSAWWWYEREHWNGNRWAVTGTTTPVHKKTGRPLPRSDQYLDDRLVPAEVRAGGKRTSSPLADAAGRDAGQGEADPQRRARHGRPPSKWLRSLHADELQIWLKTIDVPEAGVSGMTYWTHLTRDHSFDPAKIEGLTIDEQAKLHAAAHYGY